MRYIWTILYIIFTWAVTSGPLMKLALAFFQNLALNSGYTPSKLPWSLGKMSIVLEGGEAGRFDGEAVFLLSALGEVIFFINLLLKHLK